MEMKEHFFSQMKLMICLIFCFFCNRELFADTIKLKSGQIIVGEIIEKNEQSLIVDFQEVRITYFVNEIENVNGKPINSAADIKISLQDKKELLVPSQETVPPTAKKPGDGVDVEYANQSVAMADKKDLNQAIAYITKAIEVNPDVVSFYTLRADYYFQINNIPLAIADMDKAVELNPRLADNYVKRGNFYNLNGGYDLAVTDFSKAIEINPNSTEAYVERAHSYFEKRDFEKCWADVHKAEELGKIFDQGKLSQLRELSGRKE